MSTRSNIVRENLDGSYDAIYCHHDGYPSHNGEILLNHYQEEVKVNELIGLGDISSLGPELGTKHDFDNPPEGECNAYGRDREETGTKANHYANADELGLMLSDSWTEWVYTYRVADHRWYYTNNPSPTWFKLCGTKQLETSLLTEAAWKPKEIDTE